MAPAEDATDPPSVGTAVSSRSSLSVPGHSELPKRDSSFGNLGSLRVPTAIEGTVYEEEWAALDGTFRKLDKLRREYRDAAQDMTRREGSLAGQLKTFGKILKDFEERVRKDTALSSDPRWSEFMDGLAEKRKLMSEFAKQLPQKNSFLLSLAVGDINVTLPKMGDRLKYKHSYELFKLKMTFVGFVFTFLRFILDTYTDQQLRIFDALFHVFLAWYFCTIVLREHILIANGSHIRQWWLWHHYLSIATAAIILVWPDGATYRTFYPRFNLFACFVGFIQLLEFNYQRHRMYTLRALGKTDAMDLPSEGVQVQWSSGLPLLLPFIVVCQLWICYVAYDLATLSMSPMCTEWHVPALAAIFAVLAVGNIYTNITILIRKKKRGDEVKVD
eukprot:comp7317_c0_seq1/m.3017 comp7317_c0_seq1/g.3017  ORF comp7317_c0_seq1/g.3017 comp7317_c0_seq1/m.3017 type:complete len:388 (-) comp7317_c0_seq1:214-1377(-)